MEGMDVGTDRAWIAHFTSVCITGTPSSQWLTLYLVQAMDFH